MFDHVRSSFKPTSVAAVAVLSLSSIAQANTSPALSQATLSLSGFSVQLVDLNPNDGIAPSLSFLSQGQVDTQNNIYDESSDTWLPGGPVYSNSILPTTPLNYVTQDGLSTVTSTTNSVTLQSQATLSLLPPAYDSGSYFYDASYAGTNLSLGELYTGGLQSFTLSAGTGLIVRGTLSASISADVSGVEAAVNALGYEAPYVSGYAGANASFILASSVQDLFDDNGNIVGLMINQGNQLELGLGRDIFTDYATGTMLDSQSQDFEFTVTNFGSGDMNGVFALKLGVASNLSVSAYAAMPPVIETPDGGDVAPIPEPSTYALMGLGLVGIAAATRRRRHAA